MKNILKDLASRVLVASGAQGTELGKRGFPLGENYAEWGLRHPDALKDIILRYVDCEIDIFTAPPISSFGGATLIDSNNRLVGIGSLYTQVAIQRLGSIPCNMFVPIDLLKPILEDLKNIGHARSPSIPWLGFHADEAHGRVIVVNTSGSSEMAVVLLCRQTFNTKLPSEITLVRRHFNRFTPRGGNTSAHQQRPIQTVQIG